MDDNTKQKMVSQVWENLQQFTETPEDRELAENILDAMEAVDRRWFVGEANQELAYLDAARPIGGGQTISQPSTVGRILIMARVKSGEDVLEIGSGSGWNAALLGYLAYPGEVLSLEIVPELVEQARDNLGNFKDSDEIKKNARKRVGKVKFSLRNVLEIPESLAGRQFDKIVITAGIQSDQEGKIEDLSEKLLKSPGRLVCPYAAGPLLIIEKTGQNRLKKRYSREQYAFVPLKE